MVDMGFQQGVTCACVFWHKARSLVCSVHGDDFTTAGAKPDLDWFGSELDSKYELRKGGRIGPGKSDDKKRSVFNRVVRWTDDGLEYEADPRQSQKIIESIGLDSDNVRSIVTPGFKPTKQQIDSEKELEQQERTPDQGNGAKYNYLGLTGKTSSTPPRRYVGGYHHRPI